MSKVLIFGNSPLPFEKSRRLSSLNLRTWHFAKALLGDGHSVCLIAIRMKDSYVEEPLKKLIETPHDNLVYHSLVSYDFNDPSVLNRIARRFSPDCIVGVNNFPASRVSLVDIDIPVWSDLNGYAMGEAQAKAYIDRNNDVVRAFFEYECEAIEKSDLFSVTSERQKYALIGELGMFGRLNKDTCGYQFVYVIPNSIDNNLDYNKKRVLRGVLVDENDFVVLFSGSYNTWMDVGTLFDGVVMAMEREPRIKFVSTGGGLGDYNETVFKEFRDRVQKSSLKERFIFTGWIPSDQIPNYYIESDVGINVDGDIYETLLGARARIVQMLKWGLPVISTEGTEISEVLKTEQLGFIIPSGNPTELFRVIVRLSKEKRLLETYRERAREYSRKNWSYTTTTLPLRRWVNNPSFAPDHKLEKKSFWRKIDYRWSQ